MPAAQWQSHVEPLTALAAAICGRDQAGDVLQEVYLATADRPLGLAGNDLKRWLMRVTINRCRLENRRLTWRRKLLRRLTAWVRPPTHAAAPFEQDDERRSVRRALRQLDDSLRVPLVLRYFQEMNSRQIAELLEIPDATVRSRLVAARLKLAEALKRNGYSHE